MPIKATAHTPTGHILGIDPGSTHTGFGVIDTSGQSIKMVSCGAISPKSDLPMAEKLAYIHRSILDVVNVFRPKAMALEDVFTFKNPRGTIKLAQARAASILAASLSGIPVFEYSPTLVKNTITGSGRADKNQVAYMVASILNLIDNVSADASDALAVALCHAGQESLPVEKGSLFAASRNRAGSWRRLSPKDLEALGYKIDNNS
ncbi:MAG: crossover junction endodeoxyribonuclease RuvC [Deltaproteobacteria bacterium]|jgi:crossover junction endodeoxyribonuclease RuvC|nr:crossover junction endodeoxyribonuclease RuvC [Deltaproteobacteria bacterium]